MSESRFTLSGDQPKSFDKFTLTQTRPEACLVNAVGEGRKEINVFKFCLGGQDKLLLASSVVLIALRVGPCIYGRCSETLCSFSRPLNREVAPAARLRTNSTLV